MEIVFGAGGGKTKALQLLGIHLPGELPFFFAFFFAALLVKFFSSWSHTWLASMLGESFVASLRQRLFNYQVQQPVDNNSINRVSLLIPFGNDLKTMQQLLVKGVLGLVKDGLFLIMALYVLFSLQPVLTLSVVAMIILFYSIHRWYNLVHKPLFAEKRKRQASLLNYVSKVINNREQSIEDSQKIVARKTARLQATLARYHSRKSFLTALTPFMLYLLLAVIMAIITWGIRAEQLHPGEIITYILLLMTLFPTIRNIIRVEYTWVQGNLAVRKFVRASVQTQMPGEKEAEMLKKTTNNSYSLLHSGVTRQQ
jgi:ABC-type multidrug transport system fused ATPase/permease subunit